MANPVITGVDVTYPGGLGYKLPGQTAELLVRAADADSVTVVVTVTVTDSTGHQVAQDVNVIQSDPLTYAATTAAGHTVTVDPVQPNHFYVV